MHIKKIILPDSLITIGDRCFASLSTLTHITESESATSWGPNITSIGIGAFRSTFGVNTHLMNVYIPGLPPNLTYLGSEAFWKGGNNFFLNEIPKGIEEISGSTFYLCPNVAVIELGYDEDEIDGSKLNKIGSFAFSEAGKNSGILSLTLKQSISPNSLAKSNPPFQNYTGTGPIVLIIKNAELYKEIEKGSIVVNEEYNYRTYSKYFGNLKF